MPIPVRSLTLVALAAAALACSSSASSPSDRPEASAATQVQVIEHLLPARDSTGAAPTRFAWTPVEGADRYMFAVWTEVDVMVWGESHLPGPSVDVPPDITFDYGTYFWTARAMRGDEVIGDSGRAAFVVLRTNDEWRMANGERRKSDVCAPREGVVEPSFESWHTPCRREPEHGTPVALLTGGQPQRLVGSGCRHDYRVSGLEAGGRRGLPVGAGGREDEEPHVGLDERDDAVGLDDDVPARGDEVANQAGGLGQRGSRAAAEPGAPGAGGEVAPGLRQRRRVERLFEDRHGLVVRRVAVRGDLHGDPGLAAAQAQEMLDGGCLADAPGVAADDDEKRGRGG
ncbi:MAG: hypothetical protein AB1635_17920, partial [Acidobacteriota bacterium]